METVILMLRYGETTISHHLSTLAKSKQINKLLCFFNCLFVGCLQMWEEHFDVLDGGSNYNIWQLNGIVLSPFHSKNSQNLSFAVLLAENLFIEVENPHQQREQFQCDNKISHELFPDNLCLINDGDIYA